MNFEVANITKQYGILLKEVKYMMENISKDIDIDFSIELKNLDSININPDKMLNIVFVGQYSAGKSSIIKMLTENKDIKIGAGITTQEYTPYEWNGIELVDTPGVQTGLREDHDAITEKAIKDADLIIYVITNELFNPTLIKYFRKLAYDMGKAEQMILVINKMDRGGKQEVLYDNLSKVISERYDNYNIKTINEFCPCFINAESYLEAQNEDDEELKLELLQMSNYDEFIDVLNRFAEDKGLMGKIKTPIYQLKNVVDDINDILESYDNSEENSLLKNHINEINNRKKDGIDNIKRSLDIIISKIRESGRAIAGEISTDIDNNVFEEIQQEEIKEIENCINEQKNEIEKEIDDIRNDIGEELSVIGKIYCNYDFEIDTKISKKSKAISLVEDGLRKLKGSEQGIKEGLGFLGKYIYRDKIFFKQKAINSFASNAKYVSRACLVIGALVEGLEKYQEEKKNEEIKKARKEVYENFNKIAKEIECEIEKNIISPLSKELDILIQEVENTIDKNNKINDNCKLAMEQARNLKIKCDNLIQSIDI